MLNFEQRKKRLELERREVELVDCLDYALGGEIPSHYASWEKQTQTVICANHGEYQQITLTGPEYRGVPGRKISLCPDCLREEQHNVKSELRQLAVENLLDEAGIAPRFQNCEFSNYQPVNPMAEKNLSNCQRYAQSWEKIFESGTGLVMTGSCGTGKNHLAVSMAKQIIRDHLADVEITDVMRLTREVKSTWRNGAERTESEVLNRFATLDLLIIDEVGVQFGTPAELAILQEVVNARYENILPTILISNLTFDQLKAFVGDRIVDRVTDGGTNRMVFDWQSYRSNKGGKAA